MPWHGLASSLWATPLWPVCLLPMRETKMGSSTPHQLQLELWTTCWNPAPVWNTAGPKSSSLTWILLKNSYFHWLSFKCQITLFHLHMLNLHGLFILVFWKVHEAFYFLIRRYTSRRLLLCPVYYSLLKDCASHCLCSSVYKMKWKCMNIHFKTVM
jgi:hypothetical protein